MQLSGGYFWALYKTSRSLQFHQVEDHEKDFSGEKAIIPLEYISSEYRHGRGQRQSSRTHGCKDLTVDGELVVEADVKIFGELPTRGRCCGSN